MVFLVYFLSIFAAHAESTLVGPPQGPLFHQPAEMMPKREAAPAAVQAQDVGGPGVLAEWLKTVNTGNDNVESRFASFHGCCYRRKAVSKSAGAGVNAPVPVENQFVWEGGCKKESRKLDSQGEPTGVGKNMQLITGKNYRWSKTPLYSKGDPATLVWDAVSKSYRAADDTERRFFGLRFGVNALGQPITITAQQDTQMEFENEDNPATRFVKTHTLRQIICLYQPLAQVGATYSAK